MERMRRINRWYTTTLMREKSSYVAFATHFHLQSTLRDGLLVPHQNRVEQHDIPRSVTLAKRRVLRETRNHIPQTRNRIPSTRPPSVTSLSASLKEWRKTEDVYIPRARSLVRHVSFMFLVAEIDRLGEVIESRVVVLRVNRQSALVVVEGDCLAQRAVAQLRFQNVLVGVEKHLRGDDVALAKEVLQVAVQNADKPVLVAVLHSFVK